MRVALVELGNSHDECLYSQILFLNTRKDIRLTLVYNRLLEDKVKDYQYVDEFIPLKINEKQPVKTWKDLVLLRRTLISKKFDLLIFNTAQGVLMKNLMFLGLSNKKAIGILHNIKKLEIGLGQKIISKNLKAYFVLNDFLKSRIENKRLTNKPVHVFYPVFYKKQEPLKLEKGENDIWITIPGQVEKKRRDIQSLMDALRKDKLLPHIKIIFLGRSFHEHGDGKEMGQVVSDLKLTDQVLLWEDFVPLDKFQAILEHSDYIMPLIHRSHVSYDLYEAQISGAFNLGIGYQVPFLIEKGFEMYEDLQRNAVFYNIPNMVETINGLEPRKQDFNHHEKWSFEYQCQAYMNVINRLLD